MLSGNDNVKINRKWLPVKAMVEVLHGLSDHVDYEDIAQWLPSSKWHRKTNTRLVLGEPEASEAMLDHLMQHTQFDTEVANYHEILRL